MYVVIGGGGRTGAQLAQFLLSQAHEVKLVENRRDVLVHIHRELPTEIVVEGNPTEPQVMELVELGRADVLAACMQGDAENLALCFLARERFQVRRTIACINNPRNAWLFSQTFHVDVALNQSEILAKLIEQEMSLGDMMVLMKLRRGRFSFVSERIVAGSPAIGVAIKDLALPQQVVIAAILRQGEIVIPRGPLALAVDDEVLAIVEADKADDLAALLAPPVSQ